MCVHLLECRWYVLRYLLRHITFSTMNDMQCVACSRIAFKYTRDKWTRHMPYRHSTNAPNQPAKVQQCKYCHCYAHASPLCVCMSLHNTRYTRFWLDRHIPSDWMLEKIMLLLSPSQLNERCFEHAACARSPKPFSIRIRQNQQQ